MFCFFSIFLILQPGQNYGQSVFFDLDWESQTISFGKLKAIDRKQFEKEFLAEDIDSTNIQILIEQLKTALEITPEHEQLIHIHGMWGGKEKFMAANVLDFENDIISNDSLNFGSAIFVIWDSESNNYKKNQARARKSFKLLHLVFQGLSNAFPSAQFSVQCHSMGAYLFTHSISQYSENLPSFLKLLFFAPDISPEEFESSKPLFIEHFDQISIFYHQKDFALKLSKRKNKAERLGRNPNTENVEGYELIDCTAMKNNNLPGKMTKHLYYRYSEEARGEIIKRLAQ